MRLDHSTAIVTGAASGLGAATAHRLARDGARVLALDLEAAVRAAPRAPGGMTYLAADVTDEASVQSAVAEAAADADRPLRVVVSCAGIGPSSRVLSRRGRHDIALYSRVLQINLVGTFTVLAVAAEAMAANEPDEDGQRGVVVNTASIAGYEGQVGQVAYASSKAGVIGLTLPAARDLARHGIRVCAVAPGIIDTPMLATVSDEYRAGLAAGVPFPSRLGLPQDFASLVRALVDQPYVNGEVVRMDGALRMAPQ